MRRRLNGFQASRCLPGYRVQRALDILARLRTLTSPRVQAAYIRTICDGWSTKSRYQGEGPCRFGCDHGVDRLSHFAYCPKAREWALRYAGLRRPTFGLELDYFFCFASEALLVEQTTSQHATPDSILQSRAYHLYALYKLHNLLRNIFNHSGDLDGSYRQFYAEARLSISIL